MRARVEPGIYLHRMRVSDNDATSRAAINCLKMKTFGLVAAWLALLIASLITERASAVENEGVALAIVYDTSGSMKDPVSDRNGNPAPKYVVANRALIAIARQVQAYATNSAKGTPRTID